MASTCSFSYELSPEDGCKFISLYVDDQMYRLWMRKMTNVQSLLSFVNETGDTIALPPNVSVTETNGQVIIPRDNTFSLIWMESYTVRMGERVILYIHNQREQSITIMYPAMPVIDLE